jgi:hypothetical protein
MGKKKERKEIALRLASFEASRDTTKTVCPRASARLDRPCLLGASTACDIDDRARP